MTKKFIIKNQFLNFIFNNPILISFSVTLVMAPFLFLEGVYFSAACLIIIISYIPLAISAESNIQGFSFIGPFSVSFLIQSVIGAIGLFLFVKGSTSLGLEKEITGLEKIQISYLISCPFQILGFWFVFRRFKPDQKLLRRRVDDLDKRRLAQICFYLICYAFLQLIVNLFFGLDKSEADFAVESAAFNSPTAFLTVFSQIKFLGYILIPILLKNSKFDTKNIIVASLFGFVALISTTGTRSFLIYLIGYYIIGQFIFRTISFQKIKNLIIYLTIITILIIPLFDSYRGSTQFQSVGSGNIFSKINAFEGAISNLEGTDKIFTITGAAMYGKLSDRDLFNKTPDKIPYGKWENFESIFYILIPKTFFPGKPSAFDGTYIAQKYNPFVEGIATVGLNADLYRRFGWKGIPIGNLLFGLFYGFISKFLFSKFYYKNSLFSFLLILLLFVFMFSTGSVLTTFYLWMYEYLKYVLIIYFLILITKPKEKSFSKIL